MRRLTKTIWLMVAVALFGALGLVNGQTGGPNFTEFKFFSTQGAFDWDKVVYATQFEKSKLHELQVLIEFENPGEKPFNVEVKTYLDGKLIKTEPHNDMTKTGGVNAGIGGSPDTAGTVAPGVYKAELWYNGKVVKTAEATVTGTADATGKEDLKDVKSFLTGGASRRWELREVRWIDNKVFHEEEFSANEEFTKRTELAQLVPETIIFHADGSCELSYVSYYNKKGELEATPYNEKGKWAFDGQHVKILLPNDDGKIDEAKGSAWSLTNIQVSEGKFKCKFDLYGFTAGIEEIEYDIEK